MCVCGAQSTDTGVDVYVCVCGAHSPLIQVWMCVYVCMWGSLSTDRSVDVCLCVYVGLIVH